MSEFTVDMKMSELTPKVAPAYDPTRINKFLDQRRITPDIFIDDYYGAPAQYDYSPLTSYSLIDDYYGTPVQDNHGPLTSDSIIDTPVQDNHLEDPNEVLPDMGAYSFTAFHLMFSLYVFAAQLLAAAIQNKKDFFLALNRKLARQLEFDCVRLKKMRDKWLPKNFFTQPIKSSPCADKIDRRKTLIGFLKELSKKLSTLTDSRIPTQCHGAMYSSIPQKQGLFSSLFSSEPPRKQVLPSASLSTKKNVPKFYIIICPT